MRAGWASVEAPRAPRAGPGLAGMPAPKDQNSRFPRCPEAPKAHRPWPMHQRWAVWLSRLGQKKPGSPGSLACKAGHRPGSTTLRAQLLQRATQYNDLAQCHCGMWIDAPGNSIMTLYSSCDVWRGQGERPASDPRTRYKLAEQAQAYHYKLPPSPASPVAIKPPNMTGPSPRPDPSADVSLGSDDTRHFQLPGQLPLQAVGRVGRGDSG